MCETEVMYALHMFGQFDPDNPNWLPAVGETAHLTMTDWVILKEGGLRSISCLGDGEFDPSLPPTIIDVTRLQ